MRGILFALLLASAPAIAAEPPTATIKAADLQADAAILRRAYEALHPGLGRYNTSAQLDEHFRVLQTALDHEQSLSSAFLRFSEFTAKIKCGHSYPNFYNQRKAIVAAVFEPDGKDSGRERGSVPFHFRWIGQRMVITRNFSADARLTAGSEVLAIDGVSTADILQRLLPIARADGANDAKRVDYLQVQGLDRYEAFDIYYPLYYPSEKPAMTLTVRLPGSKSAIEMSVEKLSGSERRKLAGSAGKGDSKDAPAWTLDIDAQAGPRSVAVLKMPTWALYNSKWDWRAFLQKSFDDLTARNVANLVIDLRGNEGGLGVGNDILSHLVDSDLPLPAWQRRVRYRKAPDDLLPYLDTWDPSFKNWGEQAIDTGDGFYRLTRYDDSKEGDVIKPRAPHYRGRVWVLVGAGNSSATFEFAQHIQRHRLGTLVGQATGGNQRGINGGAFFFLRLPRSGIEIDLPLIGLFPAGDAPDAGLLPDLPVALSAESIASGIDAEMVAVQAAIRAP